MITFYVISSTNFRITSLSSLTFFFHFAIQMRMKTSLSCSVTGQLHLVTINLSLSCLKTFRKLVNSRETIKKWNTYLNTLKGTAPRAESRIQNKNPRRWKILQAKKYYYIWPVKLTRIISWSTTNSVSALSQPWSFGLCLDHCTNNWNKCGDCSKTGIREQFLFFLSFCWFFYPNPVILTKCFIKKPRMKRDFYQLV